MIRHVDALTPTESAYSSMYRDLRQRHRGLIQEVRERKREGATDNSLRPRITEFLMHATGAGASIQDEDERNRIQSFIDYWAVDLISRSGYSPSESTQYILAPYCGQSSTDGQEGLETISRATSDHDTETQVRLAAASRLWQERKDSGFLLKSKALESAKRFTYDPDILLLVQASEALVRLRSRYAFAVLAVLVIVLSGALATAWWQNGIATASSKELANANRALLAERKALDEKNAQLQRTVEALRIQTAVIAKAPAIVKQQAQDASESKRIVYLQIADAKQAALAAVLRRQLLKSGYVSPGVETISVPPRQLQLRYFRESDREAASIVAKSLACCGLPEPTLVFVKTKDAALQQFELWLPASDSPQVQLAQTIAALDAGKLEDRKAAAAAIQQSYASSPAATRAMLDLLSPARYTFLSPDGRINIMHRLERMSPDAWSPELVNEATLAVSAVEAYPESGQTTLGVAMNLKSHLQVLEKQ